MCLISFCFKQKTAYEMRISDWSSDVCSSDLEYRRSCADLGLIFVAPDTAPRGEDVADDPTGAYDFGLGAGFYVDATQAPFAQHYKMWTYVTEELPCLIGANFPADLDRQSILGHSMGGHGALTIALSFPSRFK